MHKHSGRRLGTRYRFRVVKAPIIPPHRTKIFQRKHGLTYVSSRLDGDSRRLPTATVCTTMRTIPHERFFTPTAPIRLIACTGTPQLSETPPYLIFLTDPGGTQMHRHRNYAKASMNPMTAATWKPTSRPPILTPREWVCTGHQGGMSGFYKSELVVKRIRNQF